MQDSAISLNDFMCGELPVIRMINDIGVCCHVERHLQVSILIIKVNVNSNNNS